MMSALRHLAANIFKTREFGFMCPPLIVFIALQLLHVNAVVALWSYALMVLFWAMAFPMRWGKLDGAASDFWYYFLGWLGVLFFFMNSGAERNKIHLAESYNVINAELAVLDAQHSAVEKVFQNPNLLFHQIRSNASTAAIQLNDPEKQKLYFQHQLEQQRQKLIKQTSDHSDASSAPSKLSIEPAPHVETIHMGPVMKALADAPSAEDMMTVLKNADVEKVEELLNMNLGPFSLPKVAEYLATCSDTSEVAFKIKARQETLHRDQGELQKKYAEIGRNLAEDSNVTKKAVKELYWPYLVICALGLRLAKYKYCSDNPTS